MNNGLIMLQFWQIRFQYFWRWGVTYGKNTGLGLFLCREIASITNILIDENGIEGEGAQFDL